MVVDAVGRFRASIAPRSARARSWLLAFAAVAFTAGSIVSFLRLDTSNLVVNAWLLALVLCVGVPVSIVLNGLEYQQVAGLVGVRIRLGLATRIAVLGSAANLAPVPGASLVRLADLRMRGVAIGHASMSVGLAGIASVFIAGSVVASAPAMPAAVRISALAVLIVGLGAIVFLNSRLGGPATIRLWVVEVAVVAATAARLFVILIAIGFSPTPTLVLLMSAAYALSAAVGIFPGGLGLREGIAGYLASAASFPAAGGFLASAIDRIIGLAVHGPLALVLAARDKRPDSSNGASPHD